MTDRLSSLQENELIADVQGLLDKILKACNKTLSWMRQGSKSGPGRSGRTANSREAFGGLSEPTGTQDRL